MIFVTGGTGIVGAHLLVDLTRKGKPVRALKRASSDTELVKRLFDHYAPDSNLYERVEWVEGDISDVFRINELLEGIDYIYHAAALVSYDPRDKKKLHHINVEGTANIVNAALERGIKRFCHVSSTAAVGRGKNGQEVNETNKWVSTPGTSDYARTKYLSEQEVWRGMAEGLDVVVVNPCLILGPGNWGQSSTSIITQVWKGLRFYTEGMNAYVDARDVSRAMVQLMESDISGERFLVVGENRYHRDVFTRIAEALQRKPPSVRATPLMAEIAWRIEWLKATVFRTTPFITRNSAEVSQAVVKFSNKKLREAIGFEFTPIDQSVKDTCDVFLGEVKASEGR